MGNNILERNVLNLEDIPNHIKKFSDQSFIIIFVDDFVGTGDSATANFDKFFSSIPGEILEKHFIYYCVICAFTDGLHQLESKYEKRIRKIIAYDYLDEKHKAFSEESDIFSTSQDRSEASRTFRVIGEQLEKKHPLGFKNMQSLVVFYDNAPNDTLPALIKGGKVKAGNGRDSMEWIPLFQRR